MQALLSIDNLRNYHSFPSSQEGAPLPILADMSIGDWFGGFLFSAGQQANEAVQDQLSALSFTRFGVVSCVQCFSIHTEYCNCKYLCLISVLIAIFLPSCFAV